MARYSRRRGPLANFELTATFVTVTGFTIRRSFGRGVLDLSMTARCLNGTGATVIINTRFLLDGVVAGPGRTGISVPAAARGTVALRALVALTQGFHVVECQVIGGAAAGDVVEADSAEFVCVEIPVWDSDEDLITL